MIYAILAAGNGSRLQHAGLKMPKPLTVVGGEKLIDRLVRIFVDADATQIFVVTNAKMPAVAHHLSQLGPSIASEHNCRLHCVETQTPSSAHSLEVLSAYLPSQPFILTTVDTIFNEHEFQRYKAAFKRHVADGGDALMGLTSFVDDEKPLYVSTDSQMRITGFHDVMPIPPTPYISAGIYGLTPTALETLHRCLKQGQSRMRNFQRSLIEEGLNVKGFAFGTVVDIDRLSDISQAEKMIYQ